MSHIRENIQREPALVVGLVGAVLTLSVSLGVDISEESQAAIVACVIAVGAIITRQAVTPNVSVGAHQDNLEHHGEMVAGDASPIPNDTPVDVTIKDEYGAVDTGILVALACIVIIICGIVWLVQAL